MDFGEFGAFAGYPNGYYTRLADNGLPIYQPVPTMPYLYPSGLIHAQEHGVPFLHERPTESKPRFSKKEVEILESYFRKNPKPLGGVKRELAEQLNVELPKINNWFQNRRARARLERNQEESRARQAAQAAQAAEEEAARDNDKPPSLSSTASISSSPTSPGSTKCDSTSPSSTDSVGRPLPLKEDEKAEASDDGAFHILAGEDSFPELRSDGFQSLLIESSECDPQDGAGSPFASLAGVIGSECLPTHLAPVQSPYASDTVSSGEDSAPAPEANEPCVLVIDQSSPETIVQSPPAPTDFKAPPPAVELARRRNKRPAPLGLVSSHHGPQGFRTASGEGPRRLDAASPIRRIASATGWAQPRVTKNGVGPGPRSPMYHEHRREALLQSMQGAHSASLGLPVASVAATAPPTPSTPLVLCLQRGARENTVSSTSSDEGRQQHQPHQPHPVQLYAQGVPLFFKPEDPTPPGTPGLPRGFQEGMYAGTAYSCNTQDEPLFTPGIPGAGGFSPELDFPPVPQHTPDYLSSNGISQPPTPSFPPAMGPAYFTACNGGGAGNVEYNWSDSYGYIHSAKSSPGQCNSRTYQFAPNMTPQHFGAEK